MYCQICDPQHADTHEATVLITRLANHRTRIFNCLCFQEHRKALNLFSRICLFRRKQTLTGLFSFPLYLFFSPSFYVFPFTINNYAEKFLYREYKIKSYRKTVLAVCLLSDVKVISDVKHELWRQVHGCIIYKMKLLSSADYTIHLCLPVLRHCKQGRLHYLVWTYKEKLSYQLHFNISIQAI